MPASLITNGGIRLCCMVGICNTLYNTNTIDFIVKGQSYMTAASTIGIFGSDPNVLSKGNTSENNPVRRIMYDCDPTTGVLACESNSVRDSSLLTDVVLDSIEEMVP